MARELVQSAQVPFRLDGFASVRWRTRRAIPHALKIVAEVGLSAELPWDSDVGCGKRRSSMGIDSPKDGAAGTTNQSPRWEGPQENKPRGYLPAKDDPDTEEDAVGETNADPVKRKVTDAMKTKGD
jgi:hypothetical protein